MSNSEWHADQAVGEKAQREWETELGRAREMRRLETERARLLENERDALYRAVVVAREKGEHYPICGMPPREVMNDREAHKAWTAAKYEAWSTPEGKRAWWAEHCVCWKAEMEAALKGA